MPPPPPPRKASEANTSAVDVRHIAKLIAQNLFTEGGPNPRRAKRLVSEFPIEGIDGTGWSEAAAASQIEKLLLMCL